MSTGHLVVTEASASSEKNGWAIPLIVVLLSAVFLAAIVILIYCLKKNRKRHQQLRTNEE